MKVAIVTRNAIHGGVESQILLQQRTLGAVVLVAGGEEHPETCPFEYRYVAAEEELLEALRGFDVILYHWPPPWAVRAIGRSRIPAVEYVHRTDTSECDKAVPTRVVTHSPFLAAYVSATYQRPCAVVPLMVDVERFPEAPTGDAVGGMTTYWETKRLDLFLRAWAQVEARLPRHAARFYGAGADLPKLRALADELGLRRVELRGPVTDPAAHLAEFALCVLTSRIEGMPVAILEALASNVPVLCCDLEGMRDFNRLAKERGFDAPLMLFESGNAADLAGRMAAFLSSPRRGATRDYMRRYYSVEQVSAQLRAELQAALEEGRRPMPTSTFAKLRANVATAIRQAPLPFRPAVAALTTKVLCKGFDFGIFNERAFLQIVDGVLDKAGAVGVRVPRAEPVIERVEVPVHAPPPPPPPEPPPPPQPDMSKTPDQRWEGGLPGELGFWRDYMITHGEPYWKEDYRARMDPETPLSGYITRFLGAPDRRIEILDVGAGPVTILGKRYPGYEVAITAVDALAEGYDQVLRELNITPLVRTQICETERLTERFAAGRFDVVFAHNTLDHHRDPVQSIREMIQVTRVGGYVVMSHFENEGLREGYNNLHQWNLSKEGEDMIVWTPGHRTSVAELAGPLARLVDVERDLDPQGTPLVRCALQRVA